MSISSSCRVTETSIMAPMPRPRRSPGAKVVQGLFEIFRPLPGQPGAFALAGEIRLVATVAMARCQERGDPCRVDVGFAGERRWRRQRRVIGAEVADVLVRQVLDDRLHDSGLALAVAHEDQLVLGEDIGLGGQRRRILDGRYALGAVTGGASLGDCRRLHRRGLGRRRSRCRRNRGQAGGGGQHLNNRTRFRGHRAQHTIWNEPPPARLPRAGETTGYFW